MIHSPSLLRHSPQSLEIHILLSQMYFCLKFGAVPRTILKNHEVNSSPNVDAGVIDALVVSPIQKCQHFPSKILKIPFVIRRTDYKEIAYKIQQFKRTDSLAVGMHIFNLLEFKSQDLPCPCSTTVKIWVPPTQESNLNQTSKEVIELKFRAILVRL